MRVETESVRDLMDTTAHGVVLFGRVRPSPGANSRCVEASGTDYDAALTALKALVPQGGKLLAIARWPL